MPENTVPVSTADKIKILYIIHRKSDLSEDEWNFVNEVKSLSAVTVSQSQRIEKLYFRLRDLSGTQFELFNKKGTHPQEDRAV